MYSIKEFSVLVGCTTKHLQFLDRTHKFVIELKSESMSIIDCLHYISAFEVEEIITTTYQKKSSN